MSLPLGFTVALLNLSGFTLFGRFVLFMVGGDSVQALFSFSAMGLCLASLWLVRICRDAAAVSPPPAHAVKGPIESR